MLHVSCCTFVLLLVSRYFQEVCHCFQEVIGLAQNHSLMLTTLGCPRTPDLRNSSASKHRKYRHFPLVNRRVVPGLSRLSTKSLCVQSLCAFSCPNIKKYYGHILIHYGVVAKNTMTVPDNPYPLNLGGGVFTPQISGVGV